MPGQCQRPKLMKYGRGKIFEYLLSARERCNLWRLVIGLPRLPISARCHDTSDVQIFQGKRTNTKAGLIKREFVIINSPCLTPITGPTPGPLER